MKAASTERKTARRVALATALGIVTSFGLLAAVLSVLKLAGASLGWGIQFQQPWFLAGMAVVTTLFAASFFDWLRSVFRQSFPEVRTVQPIGGRLSRRSSAACFPRF